MRWLVLSLLVVWAPAADSQPAPASVTMRFKGPRIGDIWKEEMFRGMVLTFTINGQPSPVTNEAYEHKTFEVLGINGNAVTKAKITYTKYTDITKRAGGAGNKAGPTLDKPYIVTSGLPTKVETAASGGKDGPVGELEAGLVREREKRFGIEDKFGKALNGKVFPIGKAVNVPAPDLFDDPSMKAKTLTLTFREMTGGNAVFDIAILMAGDHNGLKSTTDLSGRAVIDPKTATLHELTLHGTVDYRQPTVTGTGSMTLRFVLRKQ